MPDLWMPGATWLDIGDHAPTDGGPAKAIGHITWDKSATALRPVDLVSFETLRDYFGKNATGRSMAPHLLWDPFTGRIVQFYPADSRSKSVADQAGGTRTNRAGSVVIQVEALFFPYCRTPDGQVWAKLSDTPCKGWAELQAWVHSWGVPNTWAMGQPNGYVSRRSENVWEKTAGWYAHGDVPENDHTDPGWWPAFVSAPPPQPTPVEETTDMPDVITESVSGGPTLAADTYTLLHMAADSAVLQGPCRYTATCYVRLEAEPGTRVTMRFYDLLLSAPTDPAHDLPMELPPVGPDGILSAAVTRTGQLDANEQLKVEIKADAPAKVAHRVLRALRWTI